MLKKLTESMRKAQDTILKHQADLTKNQIKLLKIKRYNV